MLTAMTCSQTISLDVHAWPQLHTALTLGDNLQKVPQSADGLTSAMRPAVVDKRQVGVRWGHIV